MSNRLSAQELMSTPNHMIAWLRAKSPTDIVARDITDGEMCLGSTFLREMGYPNAFWFCSHGGADYDSYNYFPCHPRIRRTISYLFQHGPHNVTARQALELLDVR